MASSKLQTSRFPVKDEDVEHLLEWKTLDEAVSRNKIFIVDLEIMEGIPHNADFHVCVHFVTV